MTVIVKPVDPNALIADSLPLPGPLITISMCFIPFSIAFFPASSAASCAAKGVDFLEPLNPLLPEDDHEIVLPEVSVIVIIVLLKVEFICAIPDGMFFLSFFFFCFIYRHSDQTAFFLPAIGIALPFLVLALVWVL